MTAELIRALEFYSDPAHYKAPFTGGMGALYFDCGAKAREAIAAHRAQAPAEGDRAAFEAWTVTFYGGLATAADTWDEQRRTYTDYAHHMAWCLWRSLAARPDVQPKGTATVKESLRVGPLTRKQIDDIMTEHYPLDSLLRENVDAFEACVRDIEKALGVAATQAPAPVGEVVEMDDGALVPVWLDGTPAAGTKLYAGPVAAPAAGRYVAEISDTGAARYWPLSDEQALALAQAPAPAPAADLTDTEVQEIADAIGTEWGMGGLSDGLYFDYALAIHRRAMARIAVGAPAVGDQESVLRTLNAALSWGKVYGAVLGAELWDEMRGSMAAKFAADILGTAPTSPSSEPEHCEQTRGAVLHACDQALSAIQDEKPVRDEWDRGFRDGLKCAVTVVRAALTPRKSKPPVQPMGGANG